MHGWRKEPGREDDLASEPADIDMKEVSCVDDSRLTCKVQFGKLTFRGLIDTGAAVSIINTQTLKQIPKCFIIQQTKEKRGLHSASGNVFYSQGKVNLSCLLGNQSVSQTFLVVPHFKHNLLLGADFLNKQEVEMSFKGQYMTIKSERIELVTQRDLTTIGRLKKSVQVPPHQAVLCHVKLHRNSPELDKGQMYEISDLSTGVLGKEPGIDGLDGLYDQVKIDNEGRNIPYVIMNRTNKRVYFTKGTPIVTIQPVDAQHYIDLNEYEKMTYSFPPEVDVIGTADDHNEYSQLRVHNPEVTPEQLARLKALLYEYDDSFSKHEFDLGLTNLIEVDLPTNDHPPIQTKPYRTPESLRAEMSRQIQELLARKFIVRSQSEWAAAMFGVPKKGGKVRFVVNYAPFNKFALKTHYWPLTSLDHILSTLGHSRWFSSIDFSNAYMQVGIKPEDRHKTAFVCSEGLYEFTRMPFGIATAPSWFSKLMDQILCGLKNTFVTSYLDDVLIYSPTFELHCQHLKIVLDRIKQAGLKMNKSKCEFLRSELEFLGHHISRHGISPQQHKIRGIQELPVPKNLRDVRAFLGATGYYRRFYNQYSMTAKPLFQLTKKDVPFHWGAAQHEAFTKLKEQLINPPVLIHPDYDQPFTLWVDASSIGIGGVLTQIDSEGFYRPIQFFSQKLTEGQQKWSTYEREMFAVLRGVTIMRPMIYGRPLEIRTDHAPLVHHDPVKMVNPKMQRWAATLSQYGATLVYVKGKNNTIADFMSRIVNPDAALRASEVDRTVDRQLIRRMDVDLDKSDEESADVIEQPQPRAIDGSLLRITPDSIIEPDVQAVDPSLAPPPPTDQEDDIDPNPETGILLENIRASKDISDAQFHDPYCLKIMRELTNPYHCRPEMRLKYSFVQRKLYRIIDGNRTLLIVPKVWHKEILKEAHEGAQGGHFSVKRTYNTLKRFLFWPGMYKDTVEYIDKCIPCNQANLRAKPAEVEEIPIPKMPWERIHVDTYGPIQVTLNQNQYILTCVDALTGWVEFKATPTKTAQEMARFLTDQVILRHGTPQIIVTDNGTENVNHLMKYVVLQLQIKHVQTSTYNPQSNGRIERTHRFITSYISKLEPQKKQRWDEHLSSLMAAYNSTDHSSTGKSPYFLLYGREMLLPLENLLKPRETYYGDDFGHDRLTQMHLALAHARKNLQKHAAKNRERRNKDVTAEQIDEGDAVYLKNHRRASKLDPQWLPYYRVMRKTGKHTFLIKEQVTGAVVRAHRRNLRKSSEHGSWGLPKKAPKRKRRARYQNQTSSSSAPSSSDPDTDDTIYYDPDNYDPDQLA